MIAEKISLERTLIQQEHLATLGTLAARVAHEVRNPLGAIKALAQNMQRDQTLDPRYHRDLDYIVSETDRLDGCVQGVLDFSRPSSAEPRDIPASELLGNIARTLTMQYASRRLSVESQVERDWTVKGVDRQALQQVVLNLALNAVQASPPDSQVWIKGGRQPDEKPFITVSDEGPGIPAGIRERIWEPWVTTKPRGTGLGLSIVARNVQELGGEVRLDTPARGASVTVTLPGV
ncbi:MAG: hypothetical protein HY013_09520 [Candidatus Solibacter usitatus]|nr:hypothetical protein [Candidatus Solibacter usitatus]